MIEKIRFIQNPLTIIAIFAGLAEIAGTAALALVDKELQTVFIWFVMLFPLILVGLFFITLNFNPTVLYAPRDFRDEQNFLHILSSRRKLAESVEIITKQIEKESSKIAEPTINMTHTKDNTHHQNLENDTTYFLAKIRDQLNSTRIMVDAVVEDAGRQMFPRSELQANILSVIYQSKHAMTSEQIASLVGMGVEATNRALNRLVGRNMISCENHENVKVFSPKF